MSQVNYCHSKSDREHDDLVAKVKSPTDKPIKYLVLTHNHADAARPR
jgi:glyoxylase-like metal-dependent hydrolase (beta-lactamase superfamily II)